VSRQLLIQEKVSGELSEIWSWYEDQQSNLGNQFYQEFYRIVEHIINYNESGIAYKKRYRQARLLRFPYLIMYELEKDTLVIYAVIHTSRHPKSKTRKKTDF
jgi:hypothetical protein